LEELHGSTAGGIKVVVFAILILAGINGLKNRKNIVVFYRKIGNGAIIHAVTIFVLHIMVLMIAIIGMSVFDNIGLMNIIFHCVSAFSNTGLCLYDSAQLNMYGKITMIILMFVGRIGPIVAFRLFFNLGKNQKEEIEYVEGKLIL
jgi:trk system potassium uptake protein TrkH